MRDVMLIVHFIGLAMGVGTGFAHMFLSIAAKRMDEDKKTEFLLSTLYVSNMGKIGIVLLILSGGYLMTPYWSMLFSVPNLLVKMMLVVLLVVFIIVASVLGKKAKQNGGGEYLIKLGHIGRLLLLTGILTIIFAVMSFH